MGQHGNDNDERVAFPARLKPAFEVLLEASEYAQQTSGECWEFAVEIQQLRSLGLSRNDLRWLVRRELVEHAREVTVQDDNGRTFRPTGDLTFAKTTCFVLTSRGIVEARSVCREDAGNESSLKPSMIVPENPQAVPQPHLPNWDAEIRQLCINGKTVKRYKWHAINQETILAAFQEEEWPLRIDDPLPPQPQQDPKRRLSDTIKCLNRKQANNLIHFRGDGTGEGVTWELIEQNGSNGKHE